MSAEKLDFSFAGHIFSFFLIRESLKDILKSKFLDFRYQPLLLNCKFKPKAICVTLPMLFSWFVLCVVACTDVTNKIEPSAACL